MLGRNIPHTPERIEAAYADFKRLLMQEKPWKNPLVSFGNIAALMGVTPAFLRMVFQEKNVSLRDALNDRRMEEALRILDGDDTISIEKAALSAGFGTANTFSNAYCRKYGCRPTVKYNRRGPARTGGAATAL